MDSHCSIHTCLELIALVRLVGKEACRCERPPEESYQRMLQHLTRWLHNATEKQIRKLIKQERHFSNTTDTICRCIALPLQRHF